MYNGQYLFYLSLRYNRYMSYRKIPISRNKLIDAYWHDGIKQPLRDAAEILGVSHNTVRNWLIKFDLYDSRCPGREKNKALTFDNDLDTLDIHQRIDNISIAGRKGNNAKGKTTKST